MEDKNAFVVEDKNNGMVENVTTGDFKIVDVKEPKVPVRRDTCRKPSNCK